MAGKQKSRATLSRATNWPGAPGFAVILSVAEESKLPASGQLSGRQSRRQPVSQPHNNPESASLTGTQTRQKAPRTGRRLTNPRFYCQIANERNRAEMVGKQNLTPLPRGEGPGVRAYPPSQSPSNVGATLVVAIGVENVAPTGNTPPATK